MGAYSVVFTPDAEHDIEDVLQWYAQQSVEGLPSYFLAQIRKKIPQIASHPYSLPQWANSPYRVTEIPRFPYFMFFDVKPNTKTARIMAIIHQERSTAYIQTKISQRQ